MLGGRPQVVSLEPLILFPSLIGLSPRPFRLRLVSARFGCLLSQRL